MLPRNSLGAEEPDLEAGKVVSFAFECSDSSSLIQDLVANMTLLMDN